MATRTATKPNATGKPQPSGASTTAPNPAIAAAQALAAAANQYASTQKLPSSSSPSANNSRPTTTSILPPTDKSNTLTPYSLLSKEEQKLFQTKFRAAQKSPHLVEIQIKALDGLIAFLKQKRATAGAIIQASLDELKQIAKEEQGIHIKLDPLDGRIAANEARRKQLLQTKHDADAKMEAIRQHTSKAVSKTTHALDAFKQQQLKADMAFARGLSQPTAKSPAAANPKKGV